MLFRSDGYPNRVGKVYPDQQIIVIDDEEIIAAMSYKGNRNWTLPAPQLSLITPNSCGTSNGSPVGILTANTEYLYVTYKLGNSLVYTNPMHCNYYSKIAGASSNCNNVGTQDVAIRFGAEFNCLSTAITTATSCSGTICSVPQGYFADTFEIICQIVPAGQRPDPTEWKVLDFTSSLSATTVNGFISQSGITEIGRAHV